jgi:hypothetical protein
MWRIIGLGVGVAGIAYAFVSTYQAGYQAGQSFEVVRHETAMREAAMNADKKLADLEQTHAEIISDLEEHADSGNTCGPLTDGAIDRLHAPRARGGQ